MLSAGLGLSSLVAMQHLTLKQPSHSCILHDTAAPEVKNHSAKRFLTLNWRDGAKEHVPLGSFNCSFLDFFFFENIRYEQKDEIKAHP